MTTTQDVREFAARLYGLAAEAHAYALREEGNLLHQVAETIRGKADDAERVARTAGAAHQPGTGGGEPRPNSGTHRDPAPTVPGFSMSGGHQPPLPWDEIVRG
jgi:hypothetical protein